MSTVDVYRVTDQLDHATLDALIARLEARGKHPKFVQMMTEYLERMGIDSCATVLDIGCGTGVAARAIARRPAFAGRIIGIDRSPYLVSVGRRLAEEERVDTRIDFRAGDSHGLGLPDAAFDGVVAHTLLSHVDNALTVMKEIARVVRLGGKVGIFDGDYASLTYGSETPAQAEATDKLVVDALVTNPRVMREMPRLLQEAGFALEAAFAYVVADIGKADFFAPGIQAMLKLLPRSGAMSEAQARTWADAVTRQSEQGIYFGASNFYSYVAVRR
jgi:SAM-dependent methyltransferase